MKTTKTNRLNSYNTNYKYLAFLTEIYNSGEVNIYDLVEKHNVSTACVASARHLQLITKINRAVYKWNLVSIPTMKTVRALKLQNKINRQLGSQKKLGKQIQINFDIKKTKQKNLKPIPCTTNNTVAVAFIIALVATATLVCWYAAQK